MDTIAKSLSFDVRIFAAQIVLFVLLWNLLSHLFFKPILAHLHARRKQIDDAYLSVDEMRREMETLRSDYQVRIAAVEAEARARIQAAIKEAQTERERLLAEARAQSDAVIRRGVADMEREKTEALAALQGRMVDLALVAVGKALGSATDPVTLRRSIEAQIMAGGGRGADPSRN